MILGAFWNGGRQAFPGWDMEKKDEKKQETFPLWHASIGQQKPISSGLLFFMQYEGDDSLLIFAYASYLSFLPVSAVQS